MLYTSVAASLVRFSHCTTPCITFSRCYSTKLRHTMSHIKCTPQRVCIFGSGNFGESPWAEPRDPEQASGHIFMIIPGSCLADHLADASHNVLLWSRSAVVVHALNHSHTHPTCHKGHVFPAEVRAIGPGLPAPEKLKEMDVFVFAIPTEALRCAPYTYLLEAYACANRLPDKHSKTSIPFFQNPFRPILSHPHPHPLHSYHHHHPHVTHSSSSSTRASNPKRTRLR